jgi:multisubunit Na+/H+ antiporter MnhG subunit
VVPIVAITLLTVFGAPVLIVGLIMYFSFSRQRALHRTVRMMVEKGQPVPEALLNPPPAHRQRSDLRRGVILTMIGVGLMAFFAAANDWEGGSWTLGLIPFLIGAGYLLVWKLDTKKDNPPPVP